MSTKVWTPLKAIRKHCLDCSGGNVKAVMWCGCHGIDSTRCHLWPYRFGVRPESARQRYGERLVTPELMPDADVDLDDLPMLGVKEAAKAEWKPQRNDGGQQGPVPSFDPAASGGIRGSASALCQLGVH